MNKFTIDYEYGTVEFWTETSNHKIVLTEFNRFADECFGLRKSLGNTKIILALSEVSLPEWALPYELVTHALSHHGDNVVWDTTFKCVDGYAWKLLNEHGDECTCAKRGEAQLDCDVHHFWVEDHSKVCECCKK